ncbi:uncharacterized protein DDB_G0287625-like [Nylanderia fulva]|uniref:uncharacterized protein DDB_G0287625-like n=1 Tax=Nylanderia fulva TaxID=613905 RepID=UPI0010FB03A6|nr:uncharacterized protein DDB_G0287625-like [Nylanderia fulva]XP_029167709.1 uncharacterized protein DDB_G0287625-like [Nylanderia fulva]
MAKRRISSRLSKNTFFGSKFLNSDTDIIDEEQTHWWNNLDENMSSRRSSLFINNKNDLTPNSQLHSDDNISEWWKHLGSSDESSLTKSRKNLSAVLKKTHLIETTDSESETNLLKRKVLLRGRNRKSDSNAFSNALNDTENILTKGDSLKKISRRTLISDDQSSYSTKSGQDLNAVIKKSHLEITDSGSEKESNLLKKKVLLRRRSRKSDSNAFSNVLNDTENILTKDDSLKKISRRTLISDDQSSYSTKSGQDLNAVIKKSHLEITDSGSEKESNLLKKKVLLRGRSRRSNSNTFSNALNDNEDIEMRNDSLEKISGRKTLEKTSLTLSMQNINANKDHNYDDQRKEKQLSQTLSLENNEAGPSNLSSSRVMFENIAASDINKIVENDGSDIEINNHKRFKFKSYLMQRAQRSAGNNNFEDILIENRDINLSLEHNQDKEIATSHPKSPLISNSFSNSPRKSINRSKQKIDSRDKSGSLKSPIRRSSRSLNLSEYNQEKEIAISDPKSPFLTNSLSSPSRKSVNRSKQKIDSRDKSGSLKSPIRRSSRSLNLSEYNQEKEIAISDPKSPFLTNSLSSPSRKSVNRSKQKIDSRDKSGSLKSPIRRSSRSLNLSEYNQEKEIAISDPKSPFLTNSLSSPSRKSVNRSKQKIDSRDKSASLKSLIRRSPRSLNLSEHNQDKGIDISDPKSPLISNSFSNSPRKSINRSKQKIDFTYESTSLKSPIRKSSKSLRTDEPSTSNVRTFQSIFAEKYEEIQAEVARDMAAMKMEEKKKAALKVENKKRLALSKKQPRKEVKPVKVVNKAYLVNGKVWKPPPLPRPKPWATNHLYNFLWKKMESKYQLSTRVRSEKLMVQLSKIVSYIQRCKKYENYKCELEALMMEMARLNIINTRREFHHFCQEFMPYEFRIKVIPMLLPGNLRNIPFEPEKLDIPLL